MQKQEEEILIYSTLKTNKGTIICPKIKKGGARFWFETTQQFLENNPHSKKMTLFCSQMVHMIQTYRQYVLEYQHYEDEVKKGNLLAEFPKKSTVINLYGKENFIPICIRLSLEQYEKKPDIWLKAFWFQRHTEDGQPMENKGEDFKYMRVDDPDCRGQWLPSKEPGYKFTLDENYEEMKKFVQDCNAALPRT